MTNQIDLIGNLPPVYYAPGATTSFVIDSDFRREILNIEQYVQQYLEGYYVDDISIPLKEGFGKAIYLAINGDGSGNYLTADMINQLNTLLDSFGGVADDFSLENSQGGSPSANDSVLILGSSADPQKTERQIWEDWLNINLVQNGMINDLSPPFISTPLDQIDPDTDYRLGTSSVYFEIPLIYSATGNLDDILPNLYNNLQYTLAKYYWGTIDQTDIDSIQTLINGLITKMKNVSISLPEMNKGDQIIQSVVSAGGNPQFNGVFGDPNPLTLTGLDIPEWLRSLRPESLSPAVPYGAFSISTLANYTQIQITFDVINPTWTSGATPTYSTVFYGTPTMPTENYQTALDQYTNSIKDFQDYLVGIIKNINYNQAYALTGQQTTDIKAFLQSLSDLTLNGTAGDGRLSKENLAQANNLIYSIIVAASETPNSTSTSISQLTSADLTTWLNTITNNPSASSLFTKPQGPFDNNAFNYAFIQAGIATSVSPVTLGLPIHVGTSTYSTIPVTLGQSVDPDVNNQFTNAIKDFESLLQVHILSNSMPDFSADDITRIQKDFGTLVNLAVNGDGMGHYLSADMVSHLNVLLNSISAFSANNILNLTDANNPLFQITGSTSGELTAWNDWLHLYQVNTQSTSLAPLFPIDLDNNTTTLASVGGITVQYVQNSTFTITNSFNSVFSSIKSDLEKILCTVYWGGGASPNVSNLHNDLTALQDLVLSNNLSLAQVEQADSLFRTINSNNSIIVFNNPNNDNIDDIALANWLQTSLPLNPDKLSPLFPYGFLSASTLIQVGGPLDTSPSPNTVNSPYVNLLTGIGAQGADVVTRAVVGPVASNPPTQFTSDVAVIKRVLQEAKITGSLGIDPFTGTSQVQLLKDAFKDVTNISVNGVDGTYLSAQTLDSLRAVFDSLVRSTQSVTGAGVSSNLETLTTAQWQAWINNPATASALSGNTLFDNTFNIATIPTDLQTSGIIPLTIGGQIVVANTTNAMTVNDRALFAKDINTVQLIIQAYHAGVPLNSVLNNTDLNNAISELVGLVQATPPRLDYTSASNLNILLKSLSAVYTTSGIPSSSVSGWTPNSATLNPDGSVATTTQHNDIFQNLSASQWNLWLSQASSANVATDLTALYGANYLSANSIKNSLAAMNLSILNIGGTPSIVTIGAVTDPSYQTYIDQFKTAVQRFAANVVVGSSQASALNNNLQNLLQLIENNHNQERSFVNPSLNQGSLSTGDLEEVSSLFGYLTQTATGWNSSSVSITNTQYNNFLKSIFSTPVSTSAGQTTLIDPLFTNTYLKWPVISGDLSTDFAQNGTPSPSPIGTINVGGTNTSILLYTGYNAFNGTTQNTMDPVVDSTFNQLKYQMQFILYQLQLRNQINATVPSNLSQQLGQVISQFVTLAEQGDNRGNYLNTDAVQKLNTVLTSISNAIPNWTPASINEGKHTDQSPIDWSSWLDTLLGPENTANQNALTLFPQGFLSTEGTVPFEMVIGNQTLTLGASSTPMSTSLKSSLETVIAYIEGVVLQYAKTGGTPTATQIATLNKYTGQILGLATQGDGQGNLLDVDSMKRVAQLFSTLSQIAPTAWSRDQSGNLTGVSNTQWQTWLNFASNTNSQPALIPLFTTNYLTDPQPFIVLGDVAVPAHFTGSSPTDLIKNTYYGYVDDVRNILSNSSATGLTPAQIASLKVDVGSLINLAIVGYNGSYLTLNMVQNVGLLANTLTAAGATDFTNNILNPNAGVPLQLSLDNVSNNTWQLFRDLAISTNILKPMLTPDVPITNNMSLQAMVELNYVRLGNEMLANNLSKLQQALETTNTILRTMTSLQNIRNTLIVNTKIPFSTFFPHLNSVSFFGSSAAYELAYQQAASAYFNAPVYPTVPGLPPIVPPDGVGAWVNAVIPANAYAVTPLSLDPQNLYSAWEGTWPGGGSFMNLAQLRSSIGLPSNPNFSQEQRVFLTRNNLTIPGQPELILNDDQFDMTGLTTINQSSNVVMFSSMQNPGPPQWFLDKYGLAQGTVTVKGVGGVVTTYRAYARRIFIDDSGNQAIDPTAATLINDSYKATLYKNTETNLGGFSVIQTTPPSTGAINYDWGRSSPPNYNFNSSTLSTNVSLYLADLQNFGFKKQLFAGNSFLIWESNAHAWTQVQSSGSASSLYEAVTNLVKLRTTLSAQLGMLASQAPSSISDPNSLYYMANTVYKDILNTFKISDGTPVQVQTTFNSAQEGFKKWLLDGYDQSGASGGLYQQHLNFAVTAAQSLNSQQQQQVSNFLFVFEEFMKSAAAILQQLTQIIQNIAQKIAR